MQKAIHTTPHTLHNFSCLLLKKNIRYSDNLINLRILEWKLCVEKLKGIHLILENRRKISIGKIQDYVSKISSKALNKYNESTLKYYITK